MSEAIYLKPDGNGVELYRDRPRDEWPMAPDGKGVVMVSIPLDLDALTGRGSLMAKGYAEGPAAEEAERRRDELERGGGKRKAEQRLRRMTDM